MESLIFLYFAFFPFGQVFKLIQQMVSVPMFQPTDVILMLNLLVMFASRRLRVKLSKRFWAFLAVTSFSVTYALIAFGPVVYNYVGYVLRLWGVFAFCVSLSSIDKKLLKNILILEATLIAFFGLLQYLFLSDLRQLFLFGWDDHLLRLTSTFLDPAFAAALLGLGIIFLLSTQIKYKFPILVILFLAFVLTYSRSSFLALLIALPLLVGFSSKLLVRTVTFAGGTLLFLLALGGAGEGVNLLRTASIQQRIGNFFQAFEVIKISPLFGTLFNQFDNSIQSLWSMLGIVGVIFAIDTLIRLTKSSNKLFVSSIAFVIIHGMFNNTLFYPWILVWLGVIWIIERK